MRVRREEGSSRAVFEARGKLETMSGSEAGDSTVDERYSY